MKRQIQIALSHPILEWRKHCFVTIEKRDMLLFQRILPSNVKMVYVKQTKDKYDIKVVMHG